MAAFCTAYAADALVPAMGLVCSTGKAANGAHTVLKAVSAGFSAIKANAVLKFRLRARGLHSQESITCAVGIPTGIELFLCAQIDDEACLIGVIPTDPLEGIGQVTVLSYAPRAGISGIYGSSVQQSLVGIDLDSIAVPTVTVAVG